MLTLGILDWLFMIYLVRVNEHQLKITSNRTIVNKRSHINIIPRRNALDAKNHAV
jgi:hypothetical protein